MPSERELKTADDPHQDTREPSGLKGPPLLLDKEPATIFFLVPTLYVTRAEEQMESDRGDPETEEVCSRS